MFMRPQYSKYVMTGKYDLIVKNLKNLHVNFKIDYVLYYELIKELPRLKSTTLPKIAKVFNELYKQGFEFDPSTFVNAEKILPYLDRDFLIKLLGSTFEADLGSFFIAKHKYDAEYPFTDPTLIDYLLIQDKYELFFNLHKQHKFSNEELYSMFGKAIIDNEEFLQIFSFSYATVEDYEDLKYASHKAEKTYDYCIEFDFLFEDVFIKRDLEKSKAYKKALREQKKNEKK